MFVDFLADTPLVLAAGIAFISTIIQSLTGFGFAIVSTPLLLMVYDAKEVVVILQLLSVVLDTVFIFFVRANIDWNFLKPLLAGSVIGHPIGLLIYFYVPTTGLKIFIAAVILSFLCISKMCHHKVEEKRLKTGIVGCMSGILNTSTSMSGPPLILYLAMSGRDKTSLRATCIAYFTIVNYIGVMAFFLAGKDFTFAMQQSIYILPFCFLALWIGNKLFPYVSQKMFNRIIFFMLLFTAVYTIYNSLI